MPVWDATTGQLIRKLGDYKYPVRAVAFSPDGRRLVSGDNDFDSNVRVWDVTTGLEVRFSPLKGHDFAMNSVAYSPDGRWLASAGGGSDARVWNATTGKEVFKLPGVASSGATAAAFSPDGRRLATGSQEGTVKVWDVATRSAPPHSHGAYWQDLERSVQPRRHTARLGQLGPDGEALGRDDRTDGLYLRKR